MMPPTPSTRQHRGLLSSPDFTVDKIGGAFDSQARIIPMQRTRESQADSEHRPLPNLSAEELRILLVWDERKEAMGL